MTFPRYTPRALYRWTMRGKGKHLVLIPSLAIVAVLFFYVGDVPWLGSHGDVEGFLASQGYHELCLLVLMGPIVYAAVIFKTRVGIIVSIVASLAILPHAVHYSPYPDPFFRLAAFAIIIILVSGFIGRELGSKERLRTERNRLESFLSETIGAQERERQYLARELHDESAQALVDISHEIDELLEADNAAGSPKRTSLWHLRYNVESVLDGTRRFIRGLRPPLLDEMGLAPSLRWLAEELTDEFGIEVDVAIPDHVGRLPKDRETVVFRIVQESLTNVRRHSRASIVRLELTIAEDWIRLEIQDNGVGFAELGQDRLATEGKFGLIGMRERARLAGGSVDIQSKAGEGTTVTVVVPSQGEVKEASGLSPV